MLKDNEIKCYESKILKLYEEKEKVEKECVKIEKKNFDLKIEYEKFKYDKNKVENELFLLKK